ncbi:TPA: 3-hydroxyacyl-CoA dehydrogenase/enoyl-CoA hydratase family protein [Candidatus Geothermarchaeota archaeon]|nr:3-hydroxyacyl-CoA dehydrogenase/enoyl-CoA hydratase family protein [Candidatus Geothermarchaeota archaeon]
MGLSDVIRKIAVIGAGTMGHGIAEVAAYSGYEVYVYDIKQEFLDNAMEKIRWSLEKLYSKRMVREDVDTIMSRIKTSLDFNEVVRDADFVIEAVPEKIDLKKDVFRRLDELTPSHTILATNTSSLPITEIASATERPDKVVGMHFFNPPPLMPLVEVIRGRDTSPLTMRATVELAKKFGKQAVTVSKDIPGFIVNRLLLRLMSSACWLVESGNASIEAVDAVARYRLKFPMGIFELADYSGIDVFYYVASAMAERGTKIYECPLFKEKFEKGEYGVKSGRGFYEYPSPGKYVKPEIPKDAGEDLKPTYLIAGAVNEAAYLISEGIASRYDIDKATMLGLGYPKGILRYADEYGVDEIVKALEEMARESGLDEFNPNPLLKDLIDKGRLGVKSGEGFYRYPEFEEEILENIIIRYEKPIAWIILNRPDKLNALSPKLLSELSSALDKIEDDNNIRVVILTGMGRAFSAGADVNAFVGVTPFKSVILSRRFQELTNKIEYFTKPVIIMLNGFALGGGMELALSGDFRIASELAMVGQPEINLGIIPGAAGTQRLARLIGLSKAKEVIYTGDMYNAYEALEMGMVDKVVPPEYLEEYTRKFALKLAEKPPLALLAAKHSIQFGRETSIWHGEAIESTYFGLTFSTEDFIEGVSAFLEKRKPRFKGE